MAFSIQPGVWPVMITPFTEDNKPDFKAIEGLCTVSYTHLTLPTTPYV